MDEERHERIRAAVAAIPPGRVASYGEVAVAAGERSARVVGYVLRSDGADLPWHRVVRADGTCAPAVAAEQARRLAVEGVAVADGRVSRAARTGSAGAAPGSTPRGPAA